MHVQRNRLLAVDTIVKVHGGDLFRIEMNKAAVRSDQWTTYFLSF